MTMAMTTAAVAATTRRVLVWGTGGIFAGACYKAKYDPPHLVWDLDNTILCSVTPIPSSASSASSGHDDVVVNLFPFFFPSPSYKLDSFDQIDDDFAFTENKPNTRTYWRPFARPAIKLCQAFAIQHVYTTAQETYTNNILNQLDADRTIFDKVIHRDKAPQSVKMGKDLELIAFATHDDDATIDNKNDNKSNDVQSSMMLKRLILFDDRTKNFTPQNGENGVHVIPYEIKDIFESKGNADNNNNNNNNNSSSSSNPTTLPVPFLLQEGKEVGRFVVISILALLAPDVRSILPYFRSSEHNKRFPPPEK